MAAADEHLVDVLTPPIYSPSGETQDIVTAIRSGAWLHTADLWLYRTSPRFELLFQQRDAHSPTYAGLLDCSAAGYLHAGESGIDGAYREACEELGIVAEKGDIVQIGRRMNAMLDHRGRERKIIANINALQWNHELTTLRLHADEVTAVFWVSADDLRAIYRGDSVDISGVAPGGERLFRRVSRNDFVPNLDDYQFCIADRIRNSICT
jgi:isopentenyldiphosphate isomerase